MPQAVVDPEELREFARALKKFNMELRERARSLANQLAALDIPPSEVRRLWLHQANLSMNQLISRRVLGRPATDEEAPIILDEYANTSSAGSVIAFHKHRGDFRSGDIGVLSSFGAGYSIGSVILRKL